MHRVLLALCLAGAAIYTANTLLLGDKRVPFGDSDGGTAEVEQRVANQAALSPPRPNSLPNEQQASLLARDLQSAPSKAQHPETAPAETDTSPVEWAQLLRAASARIGPSGSAPRLRIFPAGTQLQVIRREKGWVLVVDASSEQGRIYEQNFVPLTAPPQKTVQAPAQTAQGAAQSDQKPMQDRE